MFKLYNRAFKVGVGAGLILFAALNVFVYFQSRCHHCVWTIGSPLPVHQKFLGTIYYNPDRGSSSDDFEYFFPENIIANIILIGLSSLGVGVLSQTIWNRVLVRRRAQS
jgi:hypothetical protein